MLPPPQPRGHRPPKKEYEFRTFALNCYTFEDKKQLVGLLLIRIGSSFFKRYLSPNVHFSRKTCDDLLAQLEDSHEGERLYCQS